MATNKNDEAWQLLFEEYDILSEVENSGTFKISAKQINKYRESRLMTKFDHTSNLPRLFSENGLSILPVSRGDYLIGKFDAYFNLEYNSSLALNTVEFPSNIESIDINKIYSEAAALNCAFVSGILNKVMGENCWPTISGRMSTSKFDFSIKNKIESGISNISVSDSQCEIDGGYESENALMIVEAKNYLVDNFLIRQLYYPYRLWQGRVKKPVIPVFLTYSNNIFSFFIFEFKKMEDYNSLVLTEQKNFAIAPEEIAVEEIRDIVDNISIISEPTIPFPQADSFKRVVDLLSLLVENDLTIEKIKTNYEFDIRQSQYYISAIQYLGLAHKVRKENRIYCCLSTKGKKVMAMPFKQKYLAIVKCILQHEVFNKTLKIYFSEARRPTKKEVVDIMKSCEIYHVDKDSSTIGRRAQSVLTWIDWILDLSRI